MLIQEQLEVIISLLDAIGLFVLVADILFAILIIIVALFFWQEKKNSEFIRGKSK